MWCQYHNSTTSVQIIKLTGSQHWERAIYPHQVVKFWAVPEARLQIFSYKYFDLLLEDHIPCTELESSADYQFLAA